VGAVVTLIALFFTHLHLHNLFLVLLVVLMTTTLFSLGGFINAIYAKKFDDISIIPTFVLTPLTYLGGVFYSIDMLPEFWQHVSHFNPILHMVNAFRYGLLGVSDIDIRIALGVTLAFILVLGGYALYLLERGTGLRT
jgi:ABC-2 type transport system permease protein